jgi:hypothetical protein
MRNVLVAAEFIWDAHLKDVPSRVSADAIKILGIHLHSIKRQDWGVIGESKKNLFK